MNISVLANGIALMMILASNLAFANPIAGTTCGVPDRSATLSGADQCAFGLLNPDAADVAGYYGNTWSSAGELTGNGADSYLAATADSGWGNIPNSGTWTIGAAFWTVYDQAVITIHVGNGGGDPDHWAWLIGFGNTGGTWELTKLSGGGGGLSNIKLWGAKGGSVVSEPGSIALVGLGMLALVVARRRKV